ncbi:hypothetical protein CCHOA_05690 [Corynebacterium choanae]|uniref:Uncharacterized protein n=1 Tax=Corynebacterium choanae TaxID=1862358 RepID=A0A3G6J9H4_9CORY|nr:hypothetical protein CCHOA_05690 [Corynebacterium choanae]
MRHLYSGRLVHPQCSFIAPRSKWLIAVGASSAVHSPYILVSDNVHYDILRMSHLTYLNVRDPNTSPYSATLGAH